MITLAGCLIMDSRGRLLLMHRQTPRRTQWELPGGKIDPGEQPAAAAIRELQEELGIKVEIVRQLGHQTFTEDGYTMEYIWFLANLLEGTPTIQETDKYDQLRYFSWDELKRRDDLSPNTRNLVAAQLRGTDLGSHSKQRRMRNERLVKDQNSRVKRLADGIMDITTKALLPLTFACECSDPTCSETISLSADEYAVAHQYPDHFIIKPGHEQIDIERIVSSFPDAKQPDYCVVEKYLVGLSLSPDA